MSFSFLLFPLKVNGSVGLEGWKLKQKVREASPWFWSKWKWALLSQRFLPDESE